MSFPGGGGGGEDRSTVVHLILTLRIRGDIPPFLQILAWQAHGQIHCSYESDWDLVCRSVDSVDWLMKGKTTGTGILTIHPYLMSNLRTDGAVPLLPPYVLMVRCLLKESSNFISALHYETSI